MSDHDDDASDINNDNAQPQQQQNIQPQIITTVSNNNAKFPYLKKDEYEVWAMKMEYWITNNDMKNLKVIQNGNSFKRTGKGLQKGIEKMQRILSQLTTSGQADYEDINLDLLRGLPSQELGKKEADTKALIIVDTLENWKEHESGDDEGFAPKEYGMVAGCMCCLVKEGYEEKIRVLSIELENTTNLLKHSERINVEAEIAKKDLQTKLDNHLAKTEKWTSSSKNLLRLIDSSMSVRTKVGLGFNDYIGENELGWDDSTFSVCTTNSEEVEGRPLFSSYLHLIKDCNYYETQYANDFDSVGYPQREPIWDNATRVTQSNQFVPQVVRLRSGKVSIPDARPNKVPAGRPKPVSTGKHPVHAGRRNSSSVTSGWWQSTARPMTHLPTPTSSYFQTSTPFGPHVYYNQMHYDGDGWATTVKPSAGCSWNSYRNKVYKVNLHTDAGDEGIVDSGCSRSMTGNKERLDDFQPI
ncbi:hypothetical protein Tco_0844850 [Tanacetum coccineum]